MDDVRLNLDANGRGEFYIADDDTEKAKMMIDITGDDLTVFHTKVLPEYEGKGLAKKLMDAMVNYARKNHLMVTAFCPYVYARFSRNPEAYDDIWKNKKK